MTALFADIVGSTGLGERLTPSEVKTLIGECVSRMTQAVESYGGTVRAYMGDGIAAFFGVDGAHEDDAVRAAFAGLRILSVISEHASEIETAWGMKGLSVRVGINSGRVGTGLVGGAKPQHVALGDAVNVAARLQGCADPGSILTGGATASLLAGRFILSRFGQVEARGRSAPVEAWRLLAYRGEPEGFLDRGGFVGRLRQLDALDRALGELVIGRGHIVIAVGDPGIGKSRLFAEWRRRADGAIQWLCARSSSGQVRRPYGPFVDILRRWLEVEADTPDVVTRVRLIARTRELFASRADLVLPSLAHLLSIEVDSSRHGTFGTSQQDGMGESLRRAYVQWLEALAVRGPLVVCIDDVDRVDSSTERLLVDLFSSTDSVPVLVAIALRREPGSAGWEARIAALADHSHRTTEFVLDPLSDGEADELLALSDPASELTPATRCELRTRAEGNPLYLEELVREALERGQKTRSGDGAEYPLPPPLEVLLLARVDRVSSAAREVLQLAAVCGRRFPAYVLESVFGGELVTAELPALIREGLIHEDGRSPSRQYSFRHGLYQEAVLTSMTPHRQQELHELVAAALESSPAADQSLEAIAGHYSASNNRERAIAYLEKAGLRALALSSLSEALTLFDRGSELSQLVGDRETHRRLTSHSADVAMQLGMYPEALNRWRELMGSALAVGERVEALLNIARTEFELGHVDAAAQTCELGLSLSVNLVTRASLLLVRSAIALRYNELDQVLRALTELEDIDSDLPIDLQFQLSSLWAGYFATQGALVEASDWAAKTLEIAQETKSVTLLLRAKRDLGLLLFIKGQMSEARELLEDVYKTSLEAGHMLRAQEAVGNLLCALFHIGALDRGASLGKEALAWVQTPFWRCAVLQNLGYIEIEMGAQESGLAHLAECARISERGHEDRISGAFARLRIARSAGGSLEVEQEVERVLEMFGTVGRLDIEVYGRCLIAEVALSDHAIDRAEEHLLKACELVDRVDRTEWPRVLRLRGLYLSAISDPDARVVLSEALEMSTEMGMQLEEGRARVALGALERNRKSPHFRAAREIFARCGSERGQSELQAVIASLN